MSTVDTTLAGLVFRAEFEANVSRESCAHTEYPDVMETPWITGLIVAAMGALHELLVDGVTPEHLAEAAEHAFITVAAAGMAAGKAMAAEDLMDGYEAFSLDSVDLWSALPDPTEPESEQE